MPETLVDLFVNPEVWFELGEDTVRAVKKSQYGPGNFYWQLTETVSTKIDVRKSRRAIAHKRSHPFEKKEILADSDWNCLPSSGDFKPWCRLYALRKLLQVYRGSQEEYERLESMRLMFEEIEKATEVRMAYQFEHSASG